jgi:K+-sensing histidine kinase KdpD
MADSSGLDGARGPDLARSRPSVESVASSARPGRGHLRIYLGSAAGVGKIYAMLCEGHRRAERGADVVVAFVEPHGRPHTSALLDGLEIIPRARLQYRGAAFEEMDLDAVLARRPQIALVDEFAHSNVPGSRNEKRWQDVEESLPEISVDPAILERVIVNLTENALRYSPEGQPPMLTASALGDRVELRVVDRGPGIPEKDRDRMFVPFQRLGDTDNTTGVGLGLALSRGLTEAMGGTLTADDTPGGGLTMTVSVPAVTEPGYGLEPGQREREGAGS